MPDGRTFETRGILDADPACGFRCGEPALDEYFARFALPNDRRGVGKTFVLAAPDGEQPCVRGFYALSMAQVDRELAARLLPAKRHDLPRYPLPVALIGRLAVHVDLRRQGYGELLLVDAMRRVLAAAEHTGCVGIIVDAKSASAEKFYERYSFKALDVSVPYPDRRLFVPLATVRQAV